MILETLDWILIAVFVLITLYIGLRFSSRAGQSLGEFFLSGRKLPWYIAGFSMVATTFAADTPLYVTEEVNKNGIAGNWFWWNMLIGGMLTTFFFARLWRRANIMTDVEFIELRYSGKPAAFLRGFKALYIGMFMNAIIVGWVNVALATILEVFFNLPSHQVIWYVAAAMVFTAIYSSVSGLWGVAIADFIQFSIAIIGCIVLAYVVVDSPEVGGIDGLKAKLPAGALEFFPSIGSGESSLAGGLTISVASFFAFIGVQWWAAWYPGGEPGGGGYVAQRMMSAKDEKNSLWATLFFQIAHYCIRSWPWIMVGLAVIVLYPDLPADQKRFGYVMAMKDFLPAGLKGLLLITFLAAYMSTISTQLNWGSSYLVNDLYKRFIRKDESGSDEMNRHYVKVSRIVTILLMLFALFATTQINTIKGAWEFIIQGSAGIGLVLILRWYWWRINAWSEIIATLAPLIGYGVSKFILGWEFPDSFFLTVAFTTVSWITATFITAPESISTLQNFYQRVRPEGAWKPVRDTLNLPKQKSAISYLLLCWLGAIVLGYSLLFMIGKIIFQDWYAAIILAASAFIGLIILIKSMKPARLLD